MNTKRSAVYALIGLMVLVAVLAVPGFVQAGGWVVVSLNKLPTNISAGQTFSVGLTALQHGQTPWIVEEVRIEAQHAETGEALTFIAKPNIRPGHYQAEVMLPQPGQWEWGVASGLYPELQPLPALAVAAGTTGDTAASQSPKPVDFTALEQSTVLLGGFVLLALAAGIVLFARSRNKQLRALTGLGTLVVVGVLAFAMFSSTRASAVPVTSAAQPAAAVDVGQQLFLAKGCVVCHTNNRAIDNSEQYSVEAGPDLTGYSNEPSYLQQFLANPSAVKTNTKMPNLKLGTDEIEALVSFINGHDTQ